MGNHLRRGLMAIASLIASSIGANAQTSDLTHMNAGYFKGSLLSLPVTVAQVEGIFKKHGLDVELINFSSGPTELNALVSGDLDVLSWTPEAIIKVNAKGLDLKAINPNNGTPVYSLIARKGIDRPNRDKPYPQNILDLKGKVIGVAARGTDMEMAARFFIKDAGLDPDRDVTWLAVGASSTAIAAFKAGRLDYDMAWEPQQTVLVDVDKVADIVVDQRKGEGNSLFKSFLSNVSVARQSQLEKNPEKYQRYAESMIESIQYIKNPNNYDRILQIFRSVSSLDDTTLRLLLTNNTVYYTDTFNCQAFDNVVEFAIQIGDVAADKKPTCNGFIWSFSHKYIDKN